MWLKLLMWLKGEKGPELENLYTDAGFRYQRVGRVNFVK